MQKTRNGQGPGLQPLIEQWDIPVHTDSSAHLTVMLVIRCPNYRSLARLADALGKPVWVITPKVAAWRYLNEGETMPSHPSARLFRQTEAGDWASVIESIRQRLLARSLN